MSTELFLSRFTPSMMSADVLEKVLVQRGDLANRLVEVIRESVVTPAKHHTLVIGSRGIGKTHLLSLVQNRIAGQEDLADRVRIAWLREEEWGIASFLDFLYRILRALAARYQDDELRAETETLFSLPLKTAERRAADLLRSFIEEKTLLLIAENLDSVFQGLGKKGQQRLRAYLQEESSWTILASSQALFGGVALYESPFYGFFDIHHLQELSVDDAARLVRNIAELANDPDLAAYVQTEAGRARIRAVHHLAGGNHRVYMILSEFLTRDSLDQLVDPFLRMMDDLTPYYQARMEQLSPQQRKIIDLLCSVRGAVPVKEIAKRCFITSQTASGQLKDLRDRGYVESTPVGRDAYYELAEPLMRLALEVKNQRNGHVRLFLDFLRHWYAHPELVDLLARTPAEHAVEREYLRWALGEEGGGETPHEVQIAKLLEEEDWGAALALVDELVQERGSASDWVSLSICFTHLNNLDEALAASEKALALDEGLTAAWGVRAAALMGVHRSDEALIAISRAISLDGSVPHFHVLLGGVLSTLDRTDEALRASDRALELAPDDVSSWSLRAYLLEKMGRLAEAVESATRALSLEPMAREARMRRGRILVALGQYSEALSDFDTLIEHERSPHPTVLIGRAISLIGLAQEALALEAARSAHAAAPHNAIANLLLARQLVQFGKYSAAGAFLEVANREGTSEELLLHVRLRVAIGFGRLHVAREDLDRLLKLIGEPSDMVTTPLLLDVYRAGDWISAQATASLVYDSYREHGRSSSLAHSLVSAVDLVIHPTGRVPKARAWVALWQDVTAGDEEFGLALRLLQALVQYRETEDPRVLLRLPLEERRIAEEVLARVREQEDADAVRAATVPG
jgi:tetratricopeptide (TPR) repeat protein